MRCGVMRQIHNEANSYHKHNFRCYFNDLGPNSGIKGKSIYVYKIDCASGDGHMHGSPHVTPDPFEIVQLFKWTRLNVQPLWSVMWMRWHLKFLKMFRFHTTNIFGATKEMVVNLSKLRHIPAFRHSHRNNWKFTVSFWLWLELILIISMIRQIFQAFSHLCTAWGCFKRSISISNVHIWLSDYCN